MSSKDGFEGRITGVVERVSPYAKGMVVSVAFQGSPKDQYPTRVTVWAGDDAPQVGVRVKVSGQISWKVEEYNGKHRAVVSVNFPKWEVLDAAPVAEPVAVGGGFDGTETPF